jgi:hypothetical protein
VLSATAMVDRHSSGAVAVTWGTIGNLSTSQGMPKDISKIFKIRILGVTRTHPDLTVRHHANTLTVSENGATAVLGCSTEQ